MQEYTLVLTLDQIRLIAVGIGEIPTKYGEPLTKAINQQLAEQMSTKPTLADDPHDAAKRAG